ncbi:hypothetical protein Tco_1067946 [Tanacetum coccineum]|uniref:40S ribosomal protein S15 n=1 Tax=Tanacetum coccineum TaxID=301880 RepID=A0ABQ5HEC6_9ASTR
MAQVRNSHLNTTQEFIRFKEACFIHKGLKKRWKPMTNASLKKLKTGDVDVDIEALLHGVPMKSYSRGMLKVPRHICFLKHNKMRPHSKKVGTQKKRLGNEKSWRQFSGLIIHKYVDKKNPLFINLIERMLISSGEFLSRTVG